MDNVKTIKLLGRFYIKGRCECPCCGHSFKFLLDRAIFIFWEGYCTECSVTPLFDELPLPGQTIDLGTLADF